MAQLKDLKDAICFDPETSEERELAVKVLDNYIEQ